MRAFDMIRAASSLSEKLQMVRAVLALGPLDTPDRYTRWLHTDFYVLQTLLGRVLTWVPAPEPLEVAFPIAPNED
jgi:hypothetical protein